ncbi:MAG: DUF481 domain-containing protein [Pseudomonadota bacterium]
MRQRILLSLVLLACAAPGFTRDKTDVIQLLNGDRITGEIKKLEYGKLRFSTDAMGTLNIEWDEIAFIDSDYAFEFELTSGDRYFGTLEAAETPQRVGIGISGQMAEFANERVIRIDPIEDQFWDRLTGSLSLGYNYTKASDVTQFSFSSSATYRVQDVATTLDISSIVTVDSTERRTNRENISLQRQRFRGKRWFTSVIGSVERNDELGLNARTSIGIGGGRYLVQSNISEFALYGGIQANREVLTGDVDSQSNVEGLAGVSYKRYIYDDPSVDISTSLETYPSLSDRGRIRAELNARIRYEVIDDLFLDLTLYDSYDSDPPSGVDSTNDYGIVTSLGWSF